MPPRCMTRSIRSHFSTGDRITITEAARGLSALVRARRPDPLPTKNDGDTPVSPVCRRRSFCKEGQDGPARLLAAEALHAGIEQRLGADRSGDAAAEVLNLHAVTLGDSGRQPGVGDRLADRVAVRGAGDVTGRYAAHEHGFLADHNGRAVVD